MPFPLAAFAFGAQLLTAVAERPPQFDVSPTCRSPARLEASLSKDGDACIRDEHKARDELTGKWGQFTSADRARCTGLVQTGGPPSYIELLTCLEMGREAQQLRRRERDTNVGRR